MENISCTWHAFSSLQQKRFLYHKPCYTARSMEYKPVKYNIMQIYINIIVTWLHQLHGTSSKLMSSLLLSSYSMLQFRILQNYIKKSIVIEKLRSIIKVKGTKNLKTKSIEFSFLKLRFIERTLSNLKMYLRNNIHIQT